MLIDKNTDFYKGREFKMKDYDRFKASQKEKLFGKLEKESLDSAVRKYYK